MSDFLLRCSSIGKLMAKPENADLFPELITPELGAILGKTKRSEDEKALLEAARRKSLSAGAKTHVRSLVREAVYSFEPAEINSRPILKGRAVEEPECIPMLARLTGRPLVKNTERRDNGLITGECDIFDAALRHGRDIKAPYSMESMPIVVADAYDSDYWWQMQGYMLLWDAETWSVDYLLVNTPEDLIGPEPAELHWVDHIPENLRWTTWLVKRDRSVEQLIVDKVTAARRYYREVLAEFDATHRGGEPPTWVTAPDEPAPPAPAAAKPAPAEALAPSF